jgi:hypothetical protein
MTDNSPKKPKDLTTDLNDFDGSSKSLFMSVSAKNISRLKDLSIENLWLIGANDKELGKILPLLHLKYLDLYQVLAKDLAILETLNEVEQINMTWSTKAIGLWDVSKNKSLKALSIIDFSKLDNIDQMESAKQLHSFTLEGGMTKPMKIKSLKPLSSLQNLKRLRLYNLKLDDDTLRPLGSLTNLIELNISNQFETEEYAWLATRLGQTECKMFKATTSCDLVDANSKLVWDTMVTGRKKPFLLSSKDQVKIDKYIQDFERLKTELAG